MDALSLPQDAKTREFTEEVTPSRAWKLSSLFSPTSVAGPGFAFARAPTCRTRSRQRCPSFPFVVCD
eukprot:scaffold7917_cov277-Pinguiococcus_pyrenoidosus.AAC.1